MNDSPLIQDYAASRSDDAFSALVEQYVGLVFSACCRQLEDRHLAEDATQAVFILLSQKAGALGQAYLSGWLLTTSRFVCSNIRKNQQRRQRRERVVAMNQPTTTEAAEAASNNELLDMLDEALCHLKPADREALVLHYLKEQSMSDVAAKLGVSPDAARKRIERGVEKLRQYFARRGIATSSTSLGTLLAEQIPGVALLPVVRRAMTQGILQVCWTGSQSTAASVSIAKGAKTMMFFAKLKIAAVLAIILAALGTGGWMISRAIAQNTRLQVAATPVPAAAATDSQPVTPAGANPPATFPSAIDLSTPNSAARSFFTALNQGDRAKAYACLTADPKRTPNWMDAMLAWNLAQNRLVKQVTQSFGGDGEPVKHIVSLDMVAYAIDQNPGAVSDAAIDGDSAVITTQIPAFMISMFPANIQPIIRNWSDKPLYFQKMADGWRFDIDRSMRVTARVMDKKNRRLDPAGTLAVIMENAQVTDEICKAIADGKITSLDDAAAKLTSAGVRVGEKHSVGSAQFNVVPAP